MNRLKNLWLALAAAVTLTGSAYGEQWPPPQKLVNVPVVVLDDLGQGELTVNQIGLFPGELVVSCFAKPADTDALCYILQPDGKVYATKRLMRSVPA